LTEAAPPSKQQITTNEGPDEIIEEADTVAVATSITPTFIAIASHPTGQTADQNIQVKFGSFAKKSRNH
jgi:hypothetical protein